MGLQVTPEDVSTAASQCSTTAGNIEGQLTQLKLFVSQMEDIWGGVAANTFQELMANYDTYSNMLYNALMDISSGLNGNSANYQENEIANVTSINNVNNALGAPQIPLSSLDLPQSSLN
jgi:WXG100 family type VII secretion target